MQVKKKKIHYWEEIQHHWAGTRHKPRLGIVRRRLQTFTSRGQTGNAYEWSWSDVSSRHPRSLCRAQEGISKVALPHNCMAGQAGDPEPPDVTSQEKLELGMCKWNLTTENCVVTLLLWKLTNKRNKSSIYPAFSTQTMPNSRRKFLFIEIVQLLNKKRMI